MNPNNQLVSVIIPAYNAEKFISECVYSVLNQTYKNIEVIIINDGSDDRTKYILEKIDDPRLFVINQENKGCSASKNLGLRFSKGDFIQYLDADDFLSLDKIEKQVELLKSNLCSIAICKTVIISDNQDLNGKEIDTEMIQYGGTGKDLLLRLLGSNGNSGMVQPNAYLIPKEIVKVIGNWNVEVSPSTDEDGEYFTRVLLAANQVYYSEGINYYRKIQNQNSLSQVHSYQRALNLLKTVELKFNHIFNLERSKLTEKLFQLNISQVAYQYGSDYPDIIKESRKILLDNTFTTLKILKPWKFKTISFLIGFERTMYLKRLLK
jgi:glycosyltransferase involved in cell wall biosynthesis